MAKKKTNTKVKDDVNFVKSNIENTPTECNAVTSEVIKTEVLTDNIKTPEDVTGSTIDLKLESTILSTFIKVTFEKMSMDLLLRYKDAVVSLIKDNQHLAEINKCYDYKIYNDAVSKINKLNRYLHAINIVIEKNIFDIEIE